MKDGTFLLQSEQTRVFGNSSEVVQLPAGVAVRVASKPWEAGRQTMKPGFRVSFPRMRCFHGFLGATSAPLSDHLLHSQGPDLPSLFVPGFNEACRSCGMACSSVAIAAQGARAVVRGEERVGL